MASVPLLLGTHVLAAGEPQPSPVPVEITFPDPDAKVVRVDDVEGRVTRKGGWPVVLVHPSVAGEPWYVQHPVDKIQDSGAFSTQAHFGNEDTKEGEGFEIVVVLARSEQEARAKFKLGMTLNAIPADLPQSKPIRVVRGGAADQPPKAETAARTIRFGKQLFRVKSGYGGPGPNHWGDSEKNVWVDRKGLHLAVTKGEDDEVLCAEVIADRPGGFGYGTYKWVIAGDFRSQDPRTIAAVFLYQDTPPHCETDFEAGVWNRRNEAKDAQFAVQSDLHPAGKRASLQRFSLKDAKVLTITLKWTKDQLEWKAWPGEDARGEPPAGWTLTYRGPVAASLRPGDVHPRSNLWQLQGKVPAKPQEIVIRKFGFAPAEQEK